MADNTRNTSNDNGKSQVAFSLASNKKKKKTKATSAAALQDFAVDDTSSATRQARPAKRTSPLVIPLTQPTTGPLAKLKQEDAAAAQALMDSAAQHYSSQQASDQGTNFSADGGLTIQSSKNTFERSGKTKEPENDSEQLQRDLESRAEDVPVESEVYSQVPIGEFGAALLRGMGWKRSDNNNNKKSDDTMGMPRPHRLGLGATPKLPESTAPGKMRRPDQVKRDERLKQQQQEYEARRQKQVRLDKQQTLQVGSIVFITDTKKRARIVQMMGVPGLNRVIVQYEGETSNTSVKKGDALLVDREELSDRPFREAKEERMSSRERAKKEENGDRKRAKREEDGGRDRDRERDRDGRRRRHEENDEYNRKNSDQDRDRNSSSSSHRRETKRQRTSASSGDAQHSRWLIPNIRLRVVTKKLSSRQYKQKGIVLDVTHGGAYATLQMNDGQILDRVPERYLETALPKVGGNAIVLTGKHRLQKGKLLERSSDSGKGVIQVFEDMNVVKLSLDDMAEWCGPLDDDMEL